MITSAWLPTIRSCNSNSKNMCVGSSPWKRAWCTTLRSSMPSRSTLATISAKTSRNATHRKYAWHSNRPNATSAPPTPVWWPNTTTSTPSNSSCRSYNRRTTTSSCPRTSSSTTCSPLKTFRSSSRPSPSSARK